MADHPIDNLMVTAMNSLRDMIDVNTIVGDTVETADGTVIIPVSKVCFGFAAGGSEFKGETIDEYRKKEKEEEVQYRLPFGGGSGAGVNISPTAFLVVTGDVVKLLTLDSNNTALDRIIDLAPDVLNKISNLVDKNINKTTQILKIEDNT